MRTRILLACAFILLALALAPGLNQTSQVSASTDIYASPIHGGCYIAAVNDCRIHVEPFTINIESGSKMVSFSLIAIRAGGSSVAIYNWRPDVSNPAPATGTTYSPSLVAQDFAAACGKTYSLNLQGRDSLDANTLSLGLTGQFACPATIP